MAAGPFVSLPPRINISPFSAYFHSFRRFHRSVAFLDNISNPFVVGENEAVAYQGSHYPPNQIVVYADFDSTLTKAGSNLTHEAFDPRLLVHTQDEKGLPSPLGLVQKSMNSQFSKRFAGLPAGDQSARTALLHDWWAQSHDYLVKSGITLASIKQSPRYLTWRVGVKEVLVLCESEGIPFIIVSAGLGNVIQEAVEQLLGRKPKFLSIVANWLIFDEKGRAIDWRKEIIHSENKHEVLKNYYPEYLRPAAEKKVVILFGDSEYDAGILGQDFPLKTCAIHMNSTNPVSGFCAGTEHPEFLVGAYVLFSCFLGKEWPRCFETMRNGLDREKRLKEGGEQPLEQNDQQEDTDIDLEPTTEVVAQWIKAYPET